MSSEFLLYGATGFVGDALARQAVQRGLKPILAGRNAVRVRALAAELGVEARVFGLDDAKAMDAALGLSPVVLHCAGPFIHTFKPVMEGCLRTGTHYLDLTGEIPVYQALADRDAEAKARHVMLLPGVGFDVVPTDCLALHLKQRLPGATRLALAFMSRGPAGLPPGTQKTSIELSTFGGRVRRNGQLAPFPRERETRMVDFGRGPVEATLFPWGDVFTAFYSTGIPNISDYIMLPPALAQRLGMLNRLRPMLKFGIVRRMMQSQVQPGPTPAARAASRADVWGQVEDDAGGRATARLHGPEAGVEWTGLAALAVVRRVLAGQAPEGFQTPARAYGADLVMECEGVTREDVD